MSRSSLFTASIRQEDTVSIDPYSEFLNYLHLSIPSFNLWHQNLIRSLPELTDWLANILNNHKDVGHFSLAPVTSAEISSAILNPRPFDPIYFERFSGPTKGDSRVFTVVNGGPPVEAKAPVDYSTWDQPFRSPGDTRKYIQKIAASGRGVIYPEDSRQIWHARQNRQVDIFLNAYLPEAGIVNWSSFFQYQQLHMRAIGYEMNGRLLWFNQMLNSDMTQTIGPIPGQPGIIIGKDAFLVSVDFVLPEQSKKYFCVYGLYIDFDFNKGTAALVGPVFKMKNEFLRRGAGTMIENNVRAQLPVAESASRPTASLPNMNAETHPFEVVQHLLDEAAYFPLFSIPDGKRSRMIFASGSSSSVIGMQVSEKLHRFIMAVDPPGQSGLCVHNTVGEMLATFEHRWMLAPDGFGALPGVEPPPTALDTKRSQRFVMLDSICRFANGKDGFRGFGSGRTYPMQINGQPQLLVGAIGVLMEGFGKFQGLEGIYTYCGSLSPNSGFSGNLLCRVMDFQGVLRIHHSLDEPRPIDCPEPDVAYLLFRGQKKNKHEKTNYLFGSHGELEGFELHPQIRILNIDCAIDDRGRLHTTSSIGPVIGNFGSYVFLNILNPGAPGTVTAPISFTDYDNNSFTNREGVEIGGFGFDGGAGSRFGHAAPYAGEGRTFTLTLSGAPGQQALRFGGYAPIVNDRGVFKGVQGLVSDNSVVGIAPHAIATTYVARLSDPLCKFRPAGHKPPHKRFVCNKDDENSSYKCEPCD